MNTQDNKQLEDVFREKFADIELEVPQNMFEKISSKVPKKKNPGPWKIFLITALTVASIGIIWWTITFEKKEQQLELVKTITNPTKENGTLYIHSDPGVEAKESEHAKKEQQPKNADPVTQIFKTNTEKKEFIFTAQQKVILNESSQVTIIESSKTETKYNLTGEGIFELNQKQGHTYIINCGKAVVQAEAGIFDIHQHNDTVHVAVISGSAKILSVGKQSIAKVVNVNQVAIITINSAVTIIDTEAENARAWYTGKLAYKTAALSEVIKDLEKTYKAKIQVSNQSILNCHFTGRLKVKDLMTSLKSVGATLNLNVEQQNNYYLLSGKGCQ